jgi:hypothetical protein
MSKKPHGPPKPKGTPVARLPFPGASKKTQDKATQTRRLKRIAITLPTLTTTTEREK